MAGSYSIETGQKNSFHIFDYILFGAILLFSAAVGIYYAIKDRKKTDIKEFLLGGGNMNVFPVTMSLVASFCSSVTLLGVPAEVYNFNTMYIWVGLAYVLSIGAAVHVFVPVYYNLQLVSIYEYLEKRFSRGVKILGTLVFIVQMLIYMAIVLYGPSLAINAVTGLSLWGTVAAVGIICTFYTALGGLKAVVWTDTFQVGIIVAGLLAALIQGSIETGGFTRAWEIAQQNQRIVIDDFRPHPYVRHGFWSLTIGGAFVWMCIYAANQAQVQRALACSTLRKAQFAIWMNLPSLLFIMLLCILIGVVMYAFYSTCDPFSMGLITASDQLFPLFVMDVLGHIPGIPGLFVACIFSGSLSTISSGLNSLAAVTLRDILKSFCMKNISEQRETVYSKILAVMFGVICLALTWVASVLGDILQAALSLFGALGAPILGVMTLGMLFPWANTWGAYAGLSSSCCIMLWMAVGTYITKPPRFKSDISTTGCIWNITQSQLSSTNSTTTLLNSTTTLLNSTTTLLNSTTSHMALLSTTSTYAVDVANVTVKANYLCLGDSFYSLSYLWYGPMAVSIVLVVGLVVSFATGAQDPETLDPRLMSPVFHIFSQCIPERFRFACRCRVGNKISKSDIKQERHKALKPSELTSFLEKDIKV